MNSVVSSLKLLPIDLIDLHEDYEPSRLIKTIANIENDQFLRHPILVTRLANDRYLVLDGVHRFMSLKKLGYTKVPVQEVTKNEFTFTVWHHLVKSGNWYKELLHNPNLPWVKDKKEGSLFIEMITNKNDRHFLYKDDIAPHFLESWHTVVSSYTKHHDVTRIPQESDFSPQAEEVLIIYGALDYDLIAQYVMDGNKLPAGVTRFQVNGRLLNLQAPLALLQESSQFEAEWAELLRKSEQSLRCYVEKVYLCER
ncbi:siderophore biosynthesis protein SbnI [Bacillus aerolatus]|uniref:Siderophore biosynthesis protein SbnI n=1 Tax=Bacillus aerolatus TaxID=2653354 RepID=A0A6I1FPL2_9BACI|nr:ParB N-terminal domain-containing protein [Bacillus aerolatus]KAB7706220.1 siderophore biosynthesis protein SbnI [Bacillus aerolatus]